MEKERSLAVNDFIMKELKWKEESKFETKWSQNQQIMWIKCNDELTVKAPYKRNVDVQKEN